MVKEVKIDGDVYAFGEWEPCPAHPFAPDPGVRWFRKLLTKNGETYISDENDMGTKGEARVEITETLTTARDLFARFVNMQHEEWFIFHELINTIYPFPQMYSEPGNYELAKYRFDRFLDIINRLLVFA